MTVPQTGPAPDTKSKVEVTPTFVDFLCFKVDPAFRRGDTSAAVAEFRNLLEKPGAGLEVRPYLTAGFRADCDFFLWLIAKDVAAFPKFVTAIRATELGRHLADVHAFLGVTKPSPYLPGHLQHFERGPATDAYCFIYPFTKTHAWYLLPLEKRRDIMKTHNEIGHQYPGVKINTTYQFGIGDYDFMLAFETSDFTEFSNLVQRLRETEARPYTQADTPLIPGVKKTAAELVDALSL
ncbi:MAG TPA: chlorite dismutase family protein [Planctomycetota bacterium]|nr:chlorite dismutase family protein [Planctomycetota bacterium]